MGHHTQKRKDATLVNRKSQTVPSEKVRLNIAKDKTPISKYYTSRLRFPKVNGIRERLLPRLSRLPRPRKPPQILRWDLLGVFLSYLWGSINNIPLPVLLRKIVYRLWAYTFHVNLSEVKHPIENYRTLRDFFSRPLKEGVRTITTEGMASPVDGKVVIFGEVKQDRVEQVKGTTYPMSGFLGMNFSEIKQHKENKLYHCVLYLAPGDYHRIHSPAQWSITKRRHFPGTLFPISPSFVRWIPNLFAMNERVVLAGEWDHGFYSLTAVGAYNVGSITLNFEQEVKTNVVFRDFRCANLRYLTFSGLGTHAYDRQYETPIPANPGDEIAQFNLGSTVVLVFEAPEFEFSVAPGQKIQMGQKLGEVIDGQLATAPVL